MAHAEARAAGEARLDANALGLVNQLFQAITHMAPAAGVIFSAQYMATQGGASHPLAWALATVAALLAAYCLRVLVAKIHSAGGYFTIHSIALGHGVGFVTSWLYFLYDPLVPAALYLAFGGIVLEPFSAAHFGFTIPWQLTLVVGTIVLTYLTARGVRISSDWTIALGALEVLIMLLLGILLVANAPDGQDLSTFTPASSPNGWGGVIFAMIFALLSFTGFESGIPLAEETREAGKALTFSVVLSTLLIGIFYVFLGYATAVGFGGTHDPAKFAQDFSGAADPYGSTLATRAFGTLGPWLVFLAILNSSLACSIAGSNATTRVYYALGRAGIFPKVIGTVHPGSQTPRAAIYLEAGITILAGLVLGYVFGKDNAFGVAGLLFTFALCVIYIMSNVAVFTVYSRRFPEEFNWLKHGAIPLVASILLLLPIWASIVYNPDPPFSYGPWIVLAWFLIGLAFYVYLRIRRPETLERLRTEMERFGL